MASTYLWRKTKKSLYFSLILRNSETSSQQTASTAKPSKNSPSGGFLLGSEGDVWTEARSGLLDG